jgi:hypothetical protein
MLETEVYLQHFSLFLVFKISRIKHAMAIALNRYGLNTIEYMSCWPSFKLFDTSAETTQTSVYPKNSQVEN